MDMEVKFLLTQYNNEVFKNPWIDYIHSIFYNWGFSDIWNIQCIFNVNWITNAVNQRLKDQSVQKWSADFVNYCKLFQMSYILDFKINF